MLHMPTDAVFCPFKLVAKIATVCVKHVKRMAEEVMPLTRMTRSGNQAIPVRILIVIPTRKHLGLNPSLMFP